MGQLEWVADVGDGVGCAGGANGFWDLSHPPELHRREGMNTRNEIHVIGAGLAGLTAAAFVARAGMPVVVHETRNRLGGRSTTDERDGFRFDQGPHALYRGGAAERVLGELGIRPQGQAPGVSGRWVRDGRAHPAPSGPTTLLRTSAVGWRGKLELGRVLATLPRLRPAEHGRRTVADWIDGTARDDGARQALAMLVRLTTYANRPEELSADVGIGMLQAGLGPGVRYLARGWEVLVDELSAVPGVRIEAGEPVRELPDAAAVIVAAGGPVNTAVLAGVDAASLVFGPAAEVSCLDMGVYGEPPQSIALGMDVPLYASLHSAPGDRAPDGCSTIALAEYLGPGVDPSRERLQAFADTVGITSDRIVTQRYLHRMVACSAIPLASQGGLAGRPGIDALARAADRSGTFVAGDWVGPEGHLADAVLASARAAALAAVHHVERQPVSR